MKNLLGFMVICVLLFASMAMAGDNPLEGYKISGKAYFDYTHDISKDGPRANGSDNAFKFRRYYITINKKLNDQFSVRFRTDADRKADDKMRPFVKHAYLQWKGLVPDAKVYVGIASTPTWGISESVWGYRGLAKTVWDIFKDVTGTSVSASSADVGIGLKGTLADKKLGYHAMIANGAHYSHPERDKYKKAYLSLSAKPGNLIVEGYTDYEAKGPEKSNNTFKGFVGYKKGKLAAGAEYYMFTKGKAKEDGSDLKMNAFSVFCRYDVKENGTAILRFDRFDVDADADDTETSLIIVAYDYRPMKSVHIIPNIFYHMNTKGFSADEKSDIVGNLTFVWSFK